MKIGGRSKYKTEHGWLINPWLISPGQNGRLFANDIFGCIFVKWKICTLIKISLKFISKSPIDNNLAMVKIMAWRRIGDKPLSESMLTRFTDAYMRYQRELTPLAMSYGWDSKSCVWNRCTVAMSYVCDAKSSVWHSNRSYVMQRSL